MIESEDGADRLLIADGVADARPDPGRSPLFPDGGEQLLHADLHNHTLLSDGAGRAQDAYGSMRAAGLDVAAITDHTHAPGITTRTLDEARWALLGQLADAADEAGEFVAVRGFEWTSPTLGHMNVWGSGTFARPLPLAEDGVLDGSAVRHGPPDDPAAIAEFYDWLLADPERALVSFNHPGREYGRFGRFRFDARIADRVVGLEMFNRGDDYLFEGLGYSADSPDDGVSPLVECLDAGWRVGLIGVTDEHGGDWGFPVDLGRTGIWAPARDRSGVRAAMARRRVFATRERGLRVDARVGDVPMGSRLDHDRGDLEFVLHVDAGPDRVGTALRVQLLQTGRPLPTVVAEDDVTIPPGGTVPFTARVDRADGEWVVLRVTEPDRPADVRAEPFGPYAAAGRALAYLSPFFLGRGGV